MQINNMNQTSGKYNNIPIVSDSKGTAYRIRPQTPKLNLLNISKN